MAYRFAETVGSGDPLVFTFHGIGGGETPLHGPAENILPDARVISPRGDVVEHGMSRYFCRVAPGAAMERHQFRAPVLRQIKARPGGSA